MKTTYPMIPFTVIVAATDGDTEAINQIVKHYSGFIAKLEKNKTFSLSWKRVDMLHASRTGIFATLSKHIAVSML